MRGGLYRGVIGVLALCAVLPWAYVQKDIVIPADMAWLTGAAQHILAGHRMVDFFYDSNPPLCYLIYIPAALLMGAGIPIWTACFIFATGFLAFFTALMAAMLRRVPGIRGSRFWAVLGGYFLAVTALVPFEFGNKDILIAIALPAFLLAQYIMTYGIGIPSWIPRLAMVAAVPLILVKPHYGLLCVLMIGHRFWRERRFSIVLDFDFLALAIGVVSYAGLIAIWFPDFISDILIPFSIHLYATLVFQDVFPASIATGVFSGSLLVLALCSDGDREAKRFAVFLVSMSMAAVIPFFVQMKGFYLHMIPVLALMVPGAFLTLSLYTKRLDAGSRGGAMIVAAGVAALSLLLMIATPYPTHNDFRNSNLAAYLGNHAKGSSFLMQSATTNIIVPVSFYSGIPHATRFSSFWFIPSIYFSEDKEKLSELASKMVAEDINRYKPALVLLYHEAAPEEDFLGLFRGYPEFDAAWESYRRVDEMKLDYDEFYQGRPSGRQAYSTFDVYERRQ